ncbi:hypothetical protein DESPIG_01855 [Desulfovibrio piger ATCC 29098]|uniref:Uncharacterized protein n=1 Tax=Desulfovibrio piger ATCC 29098 TaxID=411464 RepID=B6WUU4_9BACT|nr:hypothetical protein DESPIG_01855 [Desulfovibrio piger ATCC 29098]
MSTCCGKLFSKMGKDATARPGLSPAAGEASVFYGRGLPNAGGGRMVAPFSGRGASPHRR